MNLTALASDIAARIVDMQADSRLNNAEMIERMIRSEVNQRFDYDVLLQTIRTLESENQLLKAKLRKERSK